jgi:hypothetical protein
MLPKTKHFDEYFKILKIYNGPDHDLHNIGLPQFDVVKRLDFNKEFGTEIDKDKFLMSVTPDTDPEELSKNLALGHKIKEDPESYLRDYLKRKAYTRVNYPAIKNYIKKTIYRRKVLLKKIKMKNYTYV